MANDPNDKSYSGSSPTTAAGGSGSGGQGLASGQVGRVAQGAHEAVDRVRETLTSGTDRLKAMPQEYGEMAYERVTSNPFRTLGIAFVAGVVLSEILLPGGSRSTRHRRSELAQEAAHEFRPSHTESIGRGLRRLMDLEDGPLHGVAESAAHAAHRLERGLGYGGERLMALQHEYGPLAREQIRTHPLLLLGVGAGVCAAILKLCDE